MKILFFLLWIPLATAAQHGERSVFIYNTCFGGVTAGMGAVINKPRNENWKTALIKGIWQGSIGGMVNYSSKKTLYLIYKNQRVAYALPAKLLNAAGNSIIQNAARYEPFLQNWNIDYGPIRFDFAIHGNRKLTARFLPMSIYSFIDGAKDSKLDWSSSLWSGNLVFANHHGYFFSRRGQNMTGLSTGRSVIYAANQPDSTVHFIMAHEFVHQFQYREYQVLNAWLKPFEQKVQSKTLQNIFTRYVYLDCPYFLGIYGLEGNHPYPNYRDNFFEFEADGFASNEFIK